MPAALAPAAQVFAAVRARRPRVHCLTNNVAQAFTANVLLAIGAVPSMSGDPAEVAAFVAGADALLVNLGMLTPAAREAIGEAVAAASAAGRPWVLDPVFADRSPARADYARRLVAAGPSAIRLNEPEAAALGAACLAAARARGAVVAISGARDRIGCADRESVVETGHPLMAEVTAMGCALGAVVAACLSTALNACAATIAAVEGFGAAGARAGAKAGGPGSFVPLFLDELHGLSGPRDQLERHS
ncbi:hydroxyethylthiazole kinase [Propylenella binzhouense]|uniref:hydroxyethylthiazole kinase n=1 Tax=Propylenella binzhouense TaxID=2555902 RepID=A0A964T3E8_9HYPH|nr:hydroxyethylthiazole kinase [Propylenella binzhouense]MYZ47771.1 hydroxyethylthiazole kinase [Propylenella binzhouense]